MSRRNVTNMNTIIRLLMVVLLLGCLLKMPYGYYIFMRWCCCAGFIYLIYEERKSKNKILILALVIAAILFNPIKPVYLSWQVWHPIDVIVAILLIVWVITGLSGKSKR